MITDLAKKNKILMVRWNDNNCVTIGTNFDTVEPICAVRRWNKDKKQHAPISQPRLINNYIKFMGGVDHH
jgi:hypothetical protein